LTSIDVIIPTRNRHARLAQTLEALSSLRDRRVTAIVVDDASDVSATRIVESTNGLAVRLLRLEDQNGPARARNVGAFAATAPLLGFVDDDVDVDALWLNEHLGAVARDPHHTISIGPLLAPTDWNPTPWNRWEAETLAVEYRRMLRGEYSPTFRQFFTGNAVVPRQLFLDAGGFDERFLRAEDIELAIRLQKAGGVFRFTPEAIGWHYSRRSLESWRAIPRQYAFYDQKIAELHDPAWVSVIDRELAHRNPVTRAFLSVARAPVGGSASSALATVAGIVLSRGATMNVGQKLLSLAWQAEYIREWTGVADNPDLAPLRAKFARP
jgi:GT2 family glycosyltransferase